MNKIYRLVWNKSLNLWTVVSENARGVTKKRNVSVNTDVQALTLVQADLKQQKQYQPISTVLALTISSVLWSAGAFAATNTGGGSVSNSNGSSMAISPTASQCNQVGSSEASVSGNAGLAAGCGNIISGTNNTFQQGLINRRGTGSNPYPTGRGDSTGAATAVGKDNTISNPGGGTALGNSNVINGSGNFHNVAVGQGNHAAGLGYNVAIGIGNEVSNGTTNSSVAVGVDNDARGNTVIAVGRGVQAYADYSIAQGNTATVASGATGGLAMGHSATTNGVRGIAIGSSTSTAVNYDPATAANADGTDSVAVGTGAKGTGNQTTAVGRQAKATGANSSAYGNEANANGTSSVAVGDKAKAQGNNDIAMGLNAATASGGSNNIAVGNGVTTGATGQNVAMGSGTTTANSASSTGGAVAIGRDQKATGDGAVALGDPNTANGNGTVALGRNNTAAGDTAGNTAANGAVAIGNENKAIGQGSVALGNASTAAAAGAVALGDTANAQASNGVALGSNAVATNANDVALGSGSQTSTATGAAYRTGTAAPSSVVSVGTAGNERRIQNVSAGAADTDAVNVSQLRSVQDGVDQLGQSTANALGGGSSYDPSTGAVSNPTYTVNGTNVNNVGAAISELDKGWNLQSNGANSGAVKAGDTVDIGTADGEENLQVAKEGNNIKYSLNRDLKVDSVTAGDTVINNDGMTIAGGPSVTKSGIDAAGNKISGVAAGTDGTDAVNVDQLNQASQDLTDKGFGLTAQDGTTVQKKLGEAVDVVGADSNISTKVQDGKVAIELAKDLNVDSVTAGDTVMNTDGVTIAGGPSMTKSGIDAAGNKITNVADGDINPDSKDAINGSQLANNAQSVSDALGGGSTVNPDGTVSAPTYTVNGTNVNNVGAAISELDKGWNLQSNGANSGAVKAGDTVDIGTADGEENLQVAKEGNNIKYSLNRDLKVDSVTAGDTVVNNDGMTIAGGPSMTKSGIDAAGNKISGVAAGTDGTDAVNVDQLNQASQDLTDKGFGLTAQDGTTVQKKLGEAVDVVGADSNISTKVQDGKVAIELAKDLNVDSVTAGDTVMNTDGVTIAGGPSMTKSGIDAAGNKITNVADGDINPDSKDAINGSQLANNAQSVSDALGGGSTVNPDGTVSAPTYTVNGTNVNNVGAAITELDKGWNLQSNGANSGAVKAGDTVDIGTADGEENLQVAKEGNNIKYSLNRDLKVDSVTAGDTVINNDGMTIAGGPSVTKSGIDAAGNKISGVAAGTDGTDAVNVDQLNQASQDLTDKGFGLTAQDGTTVQKKLGEAVDVVGADSNISTKVQDGKVAIELAKDLNVDSVTAGDTVMNTDGVTIAGGPSMTKSGIDAAGNKITNVADGDINPDSKDAINGSQLANNAQSVSDALGGGSTVNPDGTVSAPTYTVNGTNVNNVGAAITELDKGWNLQSNGANSGAVKAGDTVDIGTADGEENLQVAKDGNNIKYSLNRDLKVDSVTAGDTVINNDGMTIAGGPSVTKSGIDAAGNKISGVAAGTDGTDAVNVDQLNQASQDLTDKGFGLTAQDGTTVQKKLGEAVDVVGADSNISTKVQDGKVAIELAKDLNVDSVTAGDTVMNTDGVTIAGGPSMTKSGIDAAGNKITNVADGDINPDSKDAINGSQLANNAQSVSDALGGGSTVNPDGTVSAPTYTVNGTNVNNVGAAITELDKGWNLQSNGANSGAVKAGDTVDIGTADGEENLQVAKEGNNIKYSLNRDLKVDSVTAGDTVMNTDGVTIAGGPSMTKSGIDAAGNKISGVAAGTDGTDAVNVDQLNQASQDLTDKGFGLTAQDGTTVQKKLGEAVDVVGADSNISTKVQDGKVAIELAKDLNVDSVTAGDTVMNTDGVTIAGGPSMTKSGIDAAGNKITNVADGDINPDSKDAINGSQLANNAQSVSDALGGGSTVNPDGTVSAPTYTVNGTNVNNVGAAITELDKGWNLQSNGANSGAVKAGDTVDIGTADGEENLQVAKEGNNIKYSLNRDLKVDSVTAGDTVMNTDGVTIAGGPSMTKSGIDAAGNKISGVAAGTEGTDAVNMDQLKTSAAGAKTEVEAGKNMTVDSTTGADGQTIYTVATADDVEFNSVKVGDVNIDGTTGKISGVTDGTVAAGSTEAVNGSQLHGTAQSVSDALGGGSTVNPDGTVTAPNYSVNGTSLNNVGDAITELDKGWNLQSNGANSGAVKAGDTVDIGTADGEENLQVAKEGNNIKYSLNRDLKVDSVTAGDTVINNDGMTIAGGPSVTKSGVDAAGNKITNVADGDINPDSKDAINGSQLANNAQSVSDALGGGSTVNPDGTVSAPNYSVNGTSLNNVGDAIAELDKGWNLQSNGANSGAVKAGDTVDIGTADGEENLQVAKEGNNIKYSLNRDLKVDSVTAGDTVLNNDGMTIAGGPSVTKSGIDAAGNKISGVAAGTEGTDAVNVDQLKASAAGAKTEVEAGKNMTVDSTTGADGQTIYTVSTADDVEFNSVKVGDVNIDGATGKISGVTDGTVAAGSTEAVNGSQLHGTAQSVSDALGGGSTVNPDGTVTAPNYTVNGNNVSNVGDAITELDKGWNLQSNGANSGAVKAGDTVDIGTADGEENLQVAKEGNNIKYSLNRDLNVDSVTAGNTRLDNTGVEVKDPVGNSTSMVAGGTIVKDAQGNSTAQTAAGTTIKTAQGDTTLVNSTGLAFTDANGQPVGPSVSRTGIDAGGLKVTNVADGEVAAGSKDAVNGGQLHDTAGSVGDILGGGVTNEGGKLNGPFTVNDKGYDTVADAIKAEAAAAKTEVEAGKNMTVDSTTGADGQTIYTVATADDVEFNSVKVGNVNIDGSTGKISGVTDGTVAADSTEAVNGSQLHGVADSVKNSIGGETILNPDGSVTTANVGNTGKDNIHDAIDSVRGAAVEAKTTVTQGDNMLVTESKNADGSTNYEVATARDVNFDSVQVGDVKIDSATGKITGVADGDINPESKDAINGSQLAKNAQSVSDALGGGSTVNPDGTVTAPNYTVNGNKLNNVGDAITELDKGWNLQSNGANAGAVKAGDTVDIGTADGEENLQVAKDGNNIKYSLNRDLNVDSVTAGDTVINNDGMTIAGGPSVTKAGINAGNKKITGVAAGAVRPDSTDAINGSQLNAQGEGVKNIIGGNTQYDPNTGKYTNPDVGGTGKDNINDAIGAVGAAAKAAKTTVTEGDNMVVTESKNADGSTSYEVATAKDVKFDSVTSTDEEGNETVLTAKGTQVKDGEGNEAEYGAKGVTLKDQDGNGTVLNSTGLGFVDPMGNNIGPSITAKGIDAGNTVITGVAAGRVAADSQDAINGSQLKGVSDSVAKSIGGNTTVNPDGSINTSNIGGTGKDNINDAIGAVGDAAKAAKSTVNEGKNIVVKESKNADGSSNYEVSTAPDLDVDSVTAGGTRVDGNGLTIEGGPSVTKDGIDAGDKKVTGVADGEVAAGSKDAVNGGQLKGVSDSVADVIGGNTTVNPDGSLTTSNIGGTGKNNVNDAIESVKNDAKAAKSTVSEGDTNVKVTERKNDDGSTDYQVGLKDKIKVKEVEADQVTVAGDQGSTKVTGGGISITGPKGEQGPSMTTDGINAGGKKVTGVADGAIAKGSQEGINGGQLHQSYQDVGAALGGGAGYDPDKGWKGPSYNVAGGNYNNVGDALGALDNRVTNLGDQLQQAFYDTNKRMGKLEDKMSAGIAATAALENAPFVAGKLTMAAGAAYYNDQSAIGVTFRRTADNGRWSLTTGAAMGSEGNSPLVRVGVSTVID